jgi:extradiol dioxygenase family protein
MSAAETIAKAEPHLKPALLSHGTVESHDLHEARRFYEEFLGLEVTQTSAVSLMLRLNSKTTIACVQTKGETSAGIYSHFGLDMQSEAEVDQAYNVALEQQENYGIKKITKPTHQHGTYTMYIIDRDRRAPGLGLENASLCRRRCAGIARRCRTAGCGR